jgi:DNA ligase (NAD+)
MDILCTKSFELVLHSQLHVQLVPEFVVTAATLTLSKAEAQQRLSKLRELLTQYLYEYHVLDAPSIDDAIYDGLWQEFKRLEEQYPELVTPDSPSQRVGDVLAEGFKSAEHLTRMLSLNDVFDEAEVEAWAARIQKLVPSTALSFFGDVKKDGLAASIIYQDGVYDQAITRGDGFVGEDVTGNVRTIQSVPLKLRASKGLEHFLKGRTEVRGEIVMLKKDFVRLNEQRTKAGLPLFANPRNTAAGTIRQLDPKLVAQRPLHFMGYDLLREDPTEVPSNSFAYATMKQLGFQGGEYTSQLKDLKAIRQYAEEWEKKRADLPYNIDGLVIKVNDRQTYARLGVVGKNPRAAIAYKYPAEQSTTMVKDIFVSIGRTGAATPVAMLKPVVVAGSTVQMATLHNEGEVHRKDIRVGDTVIIRKAGDVIPEVVEPIVKLRTGKEQKFVMPANCPECNTKLVKLKAKDAIWRCPNRQCPSRVHNQIQHFASKGALDIEGLGEKNVLALLDAKLIKDVADIYGLTKEQLLGLDRFAEVSASKLVAAIDQKRQSPLARFIFGLGIRHVGSQTAVDLANTFHSLEVIAEATIDELHEVEGVGVVVAESVVAWFADPDNHELFNKFRKYKVGPQEVKKVGGPLSGLRFVVTGSLEQMGREQAGEKIRALGGTFQSSVGKDTDYLVVGKNVGASKLVKADKLGTKQISEQDLLKLLGIK